MVRRKPRCWGWGSLAFTVAYLTTLTAAPVHGRDETQKFTASDGAQGDEFGIWVAVEGDAAIIGAFRDDDAGNGSGSAYVFRFDGSRWIEEQKLAPADLSASDRFGEAVSVCGDVAAISAHHQEGAGEQTGAVYVFRFDGSTWTEEGKLTASDAAAFDHYGESVSVDRDVIVIGSHFDDVGGIGSGSAYVYRFDGSTWQEEQKIIASDGAANDTFGNAASVSNNTIIVGAQEDDDAGSNSGSAYIYRYNGSMWIEEQKLTANDAAPGDLFGERVWLSGNVAIIGARLDDDGGESSGAAYVFRYNGTSWLEEQKLTAGDAAAGDQFGFSVSITTDRAVVGSVGDSDFGIGSGSAYVFRYRNNTWRAEVKLTASDASGGDRFGESVAVSNGIAIVGANFDDDRGSGSGSAYLFNLAPTDARAWETYF